MKKVTALLCTATVVGILASSVPAFAEQVVDGRTGANSGEVTVNGIIGEFDNTVPGPNPYEPNHWINVTIPTTALFWTTEESNHTQIVAPSYTVTNNSAVGVTTFVAAVNDAHEMDAVDQLDINGIELFTNGVVTVTETELFTLEGNDGVVTFDSFSFGGTASPIDASTELNPSFTLVLRFAADI
ncbi:hypothetical protein [Enterococcus gallinarum]|uniref:hypothetical protein n=1 Tax=Enterococcus gallinarum TaxID=1353 RepID=UPI0012E10CA9|nr:hypothetical protein [Enterococcus gallinarum]MUO31948.1 hypothetical protein [Enterococcus gallinarum]